MALVRAIPGITRLPRNDECPGKREKSAELRQPRIFHLADEAPALALRAGRSNENPPRQGDRRQQRHDALHQLPPYAHATLLGSEGTGCYSLPSGTARPQEGRKSMGW